MGHRTAIAPLNHLPQQQPPQLHQLQLLQQLQQLVPQQIQQRMDAGVGLKELKLLKIGSLEEPKLHL